jgi:hypothetical protein
MPRLQQCRGFFVTHPLLPLEPDPQLNVVESESSMGPRVMTSAKEFREYADECKEWAKTAKTDHERDTFLQMAKSWLDAALLVGTQEVPRQSIPLSKPPNDQDGNATA